MTILSRNPMLLSLGLLALAAPRQKEATAVFAGGRFWGTEYVFEHVRGVHYVMSGFARSQVTGTPADLPKPVEGVRVDYDPAIVSYKQLLEVFFLVAHDPTSLDRQGPDAGPESRAVAFTLFPGDEDAAREYLAALVKSKRFSKPIVTQLRKLDHFTPADATQQDYVFRHMTDAYVVQNDIPRLAALKKAFPALYTEQRAP
jgi:peptide-methionine (S)-S-oxide reductase